MEEMRWSDWEGRTEHKSDRLDPKPAQSLSAILNSAFDQGADAILPALWHWLYFLPVVPQSQIDKDGHPKRGSFLPPLPIERRMWAGGRLLFLDPLMIGDEVKRTSEIVKVAGKTGNAGRMAFVTVKHTIMSPRGLAVEEEQDIAYLEMPKSYVPPAPVPLPQQLSWQEPYTVDPVLLFRYSAVTFNAHLIHYNLKYASEVEKYPGLVVHGPLQAMLLMKAAGDRNNGRRVAAFRFRGVRPLFDFDTLVISGRENAEGGLDLYTSNGEGNVCMQATILWKS